MVYVDDLFHWPGHKNMWCHMWADTEEELHSMARQIGLKRSWFQNKPGFPHYDLYPSKRSKALIFGAMYMPFREWYKCHRLTNKLGFGSISTEGEPRETDREMGK